MKAICSRQLGCFSSAIANCTVIRTSERPSYLVAFKCYVLKEPSNPTLIIHLVRSIGANLLSDSLGEIDGTREMLSAITSIGTSPRKVTSNLCYVLPHYHLALEFSCRSNLHFSVQR